MAIEEKAFSRLDAKRQEQTPQALARLVVVVLFIALWAVLFVAQMPMPLPFLAVLLIETLFFVVYLRVVPLLPTLRSVEIAQAIMLATEIVFHTTMVYFLGTITWLGAFAYVFGLIFANTFLDLRRGLLYTTGAALAFGTLISLEAWGAIPHQAYLDQGPLRYQDATFVATTMIGAGGVFFSIFLWVNWVGFQLRNERDAALHAQEGLLKARADLERANEDLEERVLQRTAELERANAALLENEARLGTVIDNAPVVLFAVDKDGVFTLAEGTGLGTLGLTPEEVIGAPVDETFRSVPDVLENIRRALLGESFTTTVTLRGVSFETHHAPVRDEQGEITGMIGIGTDVTERRKAESELLAVKRQNELVLNSAGEGIYGVDLDGRAMFVNPAAARMLGWTPEEMSGGALHDLIHHSRPDGSPYPEAECPIYAAFRDGTQRTVSDEVFWTKGGSALPIEYISTPIQDEDGTCIGAVVTFNDITERKKAEQALQESEERFRNIFEESPIGMAIVGTDMHTISANAALAKMLGYTEREFEALSVLEITHPDDIESDLVLAQELLDGTRSSYKLDKRYLRKDGTILWGTLTASIIRDADDNALYGIGMVEDITERKHSEEALRQSEEILRRTIESTDDGILVIGAGAGVLHMNTRFGEMWNLSEEMHNATHPREFTQWLVGRTKNGEAILETLRVAYRSGEDHFQTLETTDGRLFEMYSRALLRDGNVEGRVFSFRDVTERKAAEESLRENENKFRTMAETVAAAVFIFQGTKMRYVNSAAEAATGYTRTELLEMDFWDVIHPDHRELVRERGMARQEGGDVPNRYEVKIVTKRGQERWVDFTAGMVEFEGQRAVLGTAFDVTERRRAEEALREHANRDPLTRLLNRRAGLSAIEERLQIARIEGRPFSVLVLDLDKFKSINDTYSHETGDNALLQFSRVMSDLVGEKGILTRLGGDEFEIALDGAGQDEALAFAEQIQTGLLESFEDMAGEHQARFTVSIGIACYPQDGESLLQLGREADKAMYHAKALGGSRTCSWQDVVRDKAA
jgi:diguanylate cyclase (GGDEF)-like protein/PAS domain S-box-containing protein